MGRPIQQNAPIWASLLVPCRKVTRIQGGGYEGAPGWRVFEAAAPGSQPWGAGWSTGAVSSS
jgi:hypothetical protein